MKFKRVAYRISDIRDGHKDVVGYAVKQSIVPVRIAVRRIVRGYWVADHWDTGYRIEAGSTKEQAANNALRLVNEKQRLGEYDTALIAAGRFGCLTKPIGAAT